MAYATLSAIQISAMRGLRNVNIPADAAAEVRSQLFTVFKTGFNIPLNHKVKVDLDGGDLYGVLLRKKDGHAYVVDDRGVFTGRTELPRPSTLWFPVDLDIGISETLSCSVWDAGLSSIGDNVQPWTVTLNGSTRTVALVDGTMYVQATEDQIGTYA